jgi:hypothetical protein
MAAFAKGNPGGPGRPKKADKYKGKIERAEKQIADRLPDLIDNLFELANGVLVEDVNPVTGETNVYRKPPDYKANEYLINRIMGKPTERQEISGIDGDSIDLNHGVARSALDVLNTWRQHADPPTNDPSTTPPVVLE